MSGILAPRADVMRKLAELVQERRLPWKLRWLKYIRPGRPRASLRVIGASWRDSPDLPQLFLHEYGAELVADTLDACRIVGMKPFLAFGTLLGHYRDHGFIPHDADIDFGLLQADFTKRDLLELEMQKRGYLTRLNDDREIAFYKPQFPTLCVDFFVFTRKGDSFVYHDARGDEEYEFSFPADVFDDLIPVKFLGRIDAWIPKGTEQFLEASYGDWRTPKKDFHNVHDHPNVRVTTRGE